MIWFFGLTGNKQKMTRRALSQVALAKQIVTYCLILTILVAVATTATYSQVRQTYPVTTEQLKVVRDVTVGGHVNGLNMSRLSQGLYRLDDGVCLQLGYLQDRSLTDQSWDYLQQQDQYVSSDSSPTFSEVRVNTKFILTDGADIEGFTNPGLSAGLQSIGALTTTANQMLYTTAPDTYATATLTPLSRGYLLNSTAAAWRSSLGVVPGTNVQAQSTMLQSVADNPVTADQYWYGISATQVTAGTITAQGRALLDDSTAADQRTTLGLGSIATEATPAGGVVGLTAAQTLTNKTILDSSNSVGATHLFSTGGNTISISDSTAPTVGQALVATSSTEAAWNDIVGGPAGATDNAVARFNGTSGNAVQNSGVLIDDSDNVSGIMTLTATTLNGLLGTAAQPNITSLGALSSLNVTGSITVTGLVDGVDVGSLGSTVGAYPSNLNLLTDAEVTQLANINSAVISSDNWNRLASLNQDLATTSTPVFAGLSVNNQRLTDVATPTVDSDAATKLYVDQNASGFVQKEGGTYASTANVAGTYAGTPNFTLTEIGGPSQLSLDGSTPTAGQRILLKNQTSTPENGIYTVTNNDGVSSWILTRASDFDATADITNGSAIFITDGTANTNTGWVVSGLNGSFSLDAASPTGDIPFVQNSGSAALVAGAGMSQTGSTFNVGGITDRITVNASSVDIANTYAGQTSINTLGSVTTGTWQAGAVAVLYGGTGASNASTALSNLGGQPLDAVLTGLSALTVGSADLMIYSTGSSAFATTALTVQARALLDDSTAADQRTTLGLGTMATETAANYVTLIGSESVTNKTLGLSTILSSTNLADNSDNTKVMSLDMSGISTGTTRTITVPNVNGTLMLLTATQTVTNKTLTDCTITATSNSVSADQLRTATGNVTISGSAAPSANQVLIASNATTAAWGNVPSGSAERTLIVAQSGGDFTTIAAAITAASALTPTAANPVTIFVNPGTYNETNPLVVPSHVEINGGYRAASVIVTPVTDTLAIFTMSANSTVANLTAKDASGSGGLGFRFDGVIGTASQLCTILRCNATNCETGFLCTSPTNSSNYSIMNCDQCGVLIDTASTTVNGFECTTGATMGLNNCRASGFGLGLITGAGYYANGENTFLSLVACSAVVCSQGILAQNGGASALAFVRSISGIIDFCTTGVQIGANGAVDFVSSRVGSTLGVYDINLSAASAAFTGAGNEFRADKVNITSGASIGASYISSIVGDESLIVQANLEVGSVNEKREASIGGGDSHIFGLKCRTTADDVAFNDFDTEAADTTNSFAPWPGTGAGNILYIGGNLEPFPGVKISLTTAPDFTGGAYVLEYWNGASWTEMHFMVSNADAPYLPKISFENSTNYQIRFGNRFNWATTTVDSTSAYWVRFRITSSITSVGAINQIKLHTDRTEINKDGFIEYFGKAMSRIDLPDFGNRCQPAGATPGNQDLFVSDELFAGWFENAFAGGAIEETGQIYHLPPNTFTGAPLKISFKFVPEATGGRTSWTLFYGWTTSSEDTSASTSQVFTGTGAAPGAGPNEQSITSVYPEAPSTVSANTIYTLSFDCDISGMLCARDTGSSSGDVFWWKLQRTGSSGDVTNNSDVNIFGLGGSIVTWCNGAYQSNL